MKAEDFRAYLLAGARSVFEALPKLDDELVPFAFVLSSKDEMVFVPMLGINGAESKRAAFDIIRFACVDCDAQAVGLIVETWTAEQIPGDTRLPEQRPDRDERVLVRVETHEAGIEMWSALITRTADRRHLGAFERIPNMSGRLAESFLVRVS